MTRKFNIQTERGGERGERRNKKKEEEKDETERKREKKRERNMVIGGAREWKGRGDNSRFWFREEERRTPRKMKGDNRDDSGRHI